MRVALDRDDRALLIISGSILLVATLAGAFLAPVTSSGSKVTPSSYSSESKGAKAAYMLLQDLGYQQDRWLSPPTELSGDPAGTTLILAGPTYSATSEEKLALRDFVQHGGRVIATGAQAASFLELDVVDEDPTLDDPREFSAKILGPISRGIQSVSMPPVARWRVGKPEDVEYFGDDGGGVVVRIPRGAGTTIWWADAFPLTNYGISRGSNLNLLLNSLGRPGERRILWDEYYHGERNGLWSYLGKTPLPWALIQIGLLAIVVVLTYSRRSGPIAPPAAPSRLSPIEFVETVGDLYARKHAASAALETALHRFRGLLARSLGLSRESQSLTARIADLGSAGAGLADLLSQCELAIKSDINDEKKTLKLFQELHRYTLQLRLAGQGGAA
jgi:hypothetical protein